MNSHPAPEEHPSDIPPAEPPLLRALIVEDSEIDARVLRNLLRGGGWKVDSLRVETAQALRETLETRRWDLVLCDHNLPELSAPEALEIVKASGLDLPFLIVSGEIAEGVAVAAMKAGAHDFLIKGALARLVPAVQRELREANERAARRHAQAALSESELRYRSVWENSADAVLLIDLEGGIRFANPAVTAVFGRDPATIEGQQLDSLQPDEVPPGAWWEVARSDGPRVLETETEHPDGRRVPVEIAFTEMATGNRRWVVAFARDISVRLAQQAELMRNREQFAAAREIQQRLFPQHPPKFTGFEIAGASEPAQSAGGDYYDFLTLPGGALGLVVADVSGHGVGSAMLMAEARAYLRLLSRDVGDPGLLLTAANRALAEDLGGDRYITMVLVRIDPATLRLTFASAGHPEGLVFNGGGAIKASLKRTGPPLGRRPDAVYANGPVVMLAADDLLLLVTDGIDETLDAGETDCFGMGRAAAVVRDRLGTSATSVVKALCDAVRAYAAPGAPEDDLTVLVARVLAKPEEADAKDFAGSKENH
jgi:PAS domain S-box-containing protein